MNKEEIKVMIKDCVYSEDGITYMSDKQYNNYIDIIEQLQQENSQLKEKVDYLRRSVERKEETITELECDRVPYVNEYVAKLENQQKDFIKYLNSYIELLKDKPDLVEEGQKDILEEILSKYYEIIEK